MRILVIGTGGREHALAWRLSQDPEVETVFVYPGNPGMKIHPHLQILKNEGSHKGETEFETVLRLMQTNHLSFVVIGPEKYLFLGWIDELKKRGIAAYGPTQAAAQLEGSKIYAKEFMRECGIQTAGFATAQNLTEALRAIEQNPNWSGYVLKLSGPALGKGVIVTDSITTARKTAEEFFRHRPPGIEEGMVIEEKVSGREISLFYICSGEQYRFLASACDHKRLRDGDEGPNTGGMGAYSPAPWFTEAQLARAEEEVVRPTLQGMKKRGIPFSGTLFLGLIVDGDQLTLLEYNTRFGDPETQTFLPRLKGNLAQLLQAVARDDEAALRASDVCEGPEQSVHVVKAAKGYPGLFEEVIESGEIITAAARAESLFLMPAGATLFFAGVTEKEDVFYTSGGRILGIIQVGRTVNEARQAVYQSLDLVHFKNEQFRTDIAGSVLTETEKESP